MVLSEDKPIVSIIIPCYNYGHYLLGCAESITNQTYSNWECIIIDDGSTDDTENVAMQLFANDKRFRYVKKKNGGLSSARNVGLELSVGKYIQFLDADDLILPRKLSSHVDFLNTNTSVGVVVSRSRYFEEENGLKVLREYYPDLFMQELPNQQLIACFFQKNLFTVSAPLVRKSVLGTGVRFDESLRGFEDWCFWLELAVKKVNFAFFPAFDSDTLIRRRHGSMMTNLPLMYLQELIVRKKMKSFDENYLLNHCMAHVRLIDALRRSRGLKFLSKERKLLFKYLTVLGVLSYPIIAIRYKLKK